MHRQKLTKETMSAVRMGFMLRPRLSLPQLTVSIGTAGSDTSCARDTHKVTGALRSLQTHLFMAQTQQQRNSVSILLSVRTIYLLAQPRYKCVTD